MPRNTGDMVSFVGGLPTFSSGTPFNDLEFTSFDTDYIDGENSGGDTFYPVDPADPSPGSDKVKLVRCVLNTDLDNNYQNVKRDRIILGTYEHGKPFFLKGADGLDNDYAVVLHLDFDHGAIQLAGQQNDYRLLYGTTADSCKTEGWYLFYTKNNAYDLVAFIFPCDDLEPSVSGNPPMATQALCNADKVLSLTNAQQFVFAQPIETQPAIEGGIAQFGGNGKEITGGMSVDQLGNVYLLGLTDSNLDGNTDASNEIFVSKIDSLGNVLWVMELATKEGTFLKDGVCDEEHIYVAGRTLGNLPGFTNAGRWDGIILKLRLSDGVIVAMNQWGNAGIDGYGSIILDDDGNLFVAAQGAPLGAATTDDSYLVAKHKKSDLSNVWRVIEPTVATGFSASAEAWGGLTYVKGSVPGDGRLVAAGWYIANAGANAFISIYENLNETTPIRPHSIILNAPPGATADWILDNVSDSQGNLYFAGFTTGNLQGTNLGEGDAFLVKYSPTLTNPVFKQFGTPKSDHVYKLDIDENDILYATGYTYGNYAQPNADPTLQTGDVYVQKFDSQLNMLEKTQFGTPHEDRANALLLKDKLYVAGTTEGAMVGPSKGSFDGYALALNRSNLQVHNFDNPSSTVEWQGKSGIKLFPNPTNGRFNIETWGDQYTDYMLLNLQGLIVLSGKLEAITTEIDLSALSNGVYVMQVRSKEGVLNKSKIVKIK